MANTTHWDDDKRLGFQNGNLCPLCPEYRPDKEPNERESQLDPTKPPRPHCQECRRRYQRERIQAELKHGTTTEATRKPGRRPNPMCPRCDRVRPKVPGSGYCEECRREYQKLRHKNRKVEGAIQAERIERLEAQELDVRIERYKESDY